ncbi:17459_t:CDS:2, partial [Gigaspora rosea]
MAFPSVNDLTARLEKLEQNITLTLQEIDDNFSTCQHKVSIRILPQISRFAEVSEEIWENSKLWWSFFESLDLSSSNDNSSPPPNKLLQSSSNNLCSNFGGSCNGVHSHATTSTYMSMPALPPLIER